MKKTITLFFGAVLIMASCINIYKFCNGIHTYGEVTRVSNIKKCSYGINMNPFYRSFYEEDVKIYYTFDTGENPPDCTYSYKNILVRRCFEQQLPTIGDKIPIIIDTGRYTSGRIMEENPVYIIKTIFMMLSGIIIILFGIKNRGDKDNAKDEK